MLVKNSHVSMFQVFYFSSKLINTVLFCIFKFIFFLFVSYSLLNILIAIKVHTKEKNMMISYVKNVISNKCYERLILKSTVLVNFLGDKNDNIIVSDIHLNKS